MSNFARRIFRKGMAVAAATAVFCGQMVPVTAHAASVRIKDIVDYEGVRDNPIVGYGLVVGLNGTGDRLTNTLFTRETLVGMLNRLGVNIRDRSIQLQTHDVATVMVTAWLPAFSHGGSHIDVTVSAVGDAQSLTGGTLVATPLKAADGETYAVAQGSLVTNAFTATGASASITRNVPTSGHIANGASVEREVPVLLGSSGVIHLSLKNPNFTTANRIANVINKNLGKGVAKVDDPRTVAVHLQGRKAAQTLYEIGDLTIEPDTMAKVIVDEAAGTIVMGSNVRISTVAIAQGNLTIQVAETPQAVQPNPLAGGQTAVVPRTQVNATTGSQERLGILKEGPTLSSLVTGMNALGMGPRDMISILQAIKADGALQADLEVR
ncbi:flagellar basal body P-ring biosynthesis protein FlgA [Acetobacter malorum DSM 14337]|uniref:Flagellar P-ring protein n=1 Tax=Acetobacter malorum DSM 14337 TaxID=1307910 RepID=A0ABQ0Q0Z1_9PROT|nr:flagellar biosynthesis protein FlgA [Acetobacter malorum]GBQ86454.1 flagellar basal body P-ring biosynthesis protein FlgA [Acetobacter malorum DSM 14337]